MYHHIFYTRSHESRFEICTNLYSHNRFTQQREVFVTWKQTKSIIRCPEIGVLTRSDSAVRSVFFTICESRYRMMLSMLRVPSINLFLSAVLCLRIIRFIKSTCLHGDWRRVIYWSGLSSWVRQADGRRAWKQKALVTKITRAESLTSPFVHLNRAWMRLSASHRSFNQLR